MEYSSNEGLNDVKNTKAHDIENIHFMLHQKYIAFEEYQNSTQRTEYVYLHKKEH